MQRRLSLAWVSYLVTWRKIFTAPRSNVSSDVLLMIRLLFTVPVSNAKLERIFFKLNSVKINFRWSLVVKRLDNILRIMEESSSWETFDPISAIKKMRIDKVTRATEVKGPQSYKWRNSAEVKWMLNLSVMMTVTMRKKIFLKMRTKKDICFLLIPSKIIKNKFLFCS